MWIDKAGKIVRMAPGELPVPILRERMQRELAGELRLRQTAERKKKVQALRTAINLTYEFDYEPSSEEIQGRGFSVQNFQVPALVRESVSPNHLIRE